MSLPRPRTVQFQIAIRARVPRGTVISNDQANQATREWIENGNAPRGWRIRVVIWEAHRKREINEIDSSQRGDALRATLRRALQDGRLVIKTLGSH